MKEVEIPNICKMLWIWIVSALLFLSPRAEAFDCGSTIELLAGHIFSPVIIGADRQDLNYLSLDVRYEFLRPFKPMPLFLEATYNRTTKGPDGYMAGLTILARYQFPSVQFILPYVQMGAGVLYNNIYKDYSQDLIGNNMEFNPQLALGLKYKISSSCAFHLEFGFQHISNAGLGDRNVGVNGIGGFIGFSWSLK